MDDSDKKVYRYEDTRRIDGPPVEFDGVAFAIHVLQVLKLRDITVVVRRGTWEINISQGRNWAESGYKRWAIVSIPPTATRQQIAHALMDLDGTSQNPYIYDLLVGPYRG